ncbi:hypothetical protein ACQPXT_34210 [Streptomyces sp. CA-100214]
MHVLPPYHGHLASRADGASATAHGPYGLTSRPAAVCVIVAYGGA